MFAGRQKFDNKLMNETLERFRQIGFLILNNFYQIRTLAHPFFLEFANLTKLFTLPNCS